jgi:undecaprenyl-diphosphatase
MNTVEAFNQALFLDINGSAATSHWVVGLALVCAKYLAVLVPLLLAGLWLTGRDWQREVALRAAVVMLLAFVASFLIGLAWPHPRPFVIGLGHLFLPHAPDPSFPSDHVTAFAAVALTLLAGGLRRWGVAVALAGLAVAWGRVFAGVHFPLDMLGAVVVAGLAYAVIAPFWWSRGSALTDALIALYRRLFALPIRIGWLRR